MNLNLYEYVKKQLNSDTFVTIIRFAGGNLFVVFLGVISTLLYTKWITPDILGEFRKYAILTGYLSIGKFIVDAAYRRNFTVLFGKGEVNAALHTASVVKLYYEVLIIISSSVFAILAIYSFYIDDYYGVFGWLLQIVIFTSTSYNDFLNPQFKTNNDFKILTKINVSSAIAGLISLPLVYFFNYYGLILRTTVQNFTRIIFFRKNIRHWVHAKFDNKEFFSLAKTSIPLQFPTAFESYIFKPTINWYILSSLGKHDLGIYSMAIIFTTLLRTMSSSINQVFNTKSTLQYGNHKNISEAFRFIIRPTLISGLFGIVLVIVYLTILYFFFNLVATNYIYSFDVLRVKSFEIVLVLLSAPFIIFTNSLMYGARILLGFVKMGLTFILLLVLPVTLVNISIAILVGYFGHTILGYYLLLREIAKDKIIT